MKALGYIRVSTERQADAGGSLRAQRQKIEAMAVVLGADLVDVIVDAGASAKSLDRPGMERLLALVDAGHVQTVIIAKLDRLTRSVADLATLLQRFERKSVGLVSVADSLDTKTAAGRLVLNIMTSVSQWEREAIGERTRDVLQSMKTRGLRVGSVPYGWREAQGRLEPHPDEQRVVATMHDWRRHMTLRDLTARLNAQGYRTRRGTAWRHQYVAAVLRSQPDTAQPIAA